MLTGCGFDDVAGTVTAKNTFIAPFVNAEETQWLVVGPTVSLTHGRFWGAATLGIGVFGIRDAPRLTFGVAL